MTDPDKTQAVIDQVTASVRPPRRFDKAQVAIAALGAIAVILIVAMVLGMYAVLGARHTKQADFNRNFNAGLCKMVDFLADPLTAPTPDEVRFRAHYGCAARAAK